MLISAILGFSAHLAQLIFNRVLRSLGPNNVEIFLLGQRSRQLVNVIAKNLRTRLLRVQIFLSPFLAVSFTDDGNKHIEEHNLGHERGEQEVKVNQDD